MNPKLFLAVLFGLPPFLLGLIHAYTLFGHRVRVTLRERAVYIEHPRAEYEVTLRLPGNPWSLVIKTRYDLDPFN